MPGSGHLVSLFSLAAKLELLHHLLPEAGEAEPEDKITTQIGNEVYRQLL